MAGHSRNAGQLRIGQPVLRLGPEPAIHWAENGWSVRPHVHYWWSDEGAMGRAPMASS